MPYFVPSPGWGWMLSHEVRFFTSPPGWWGCNHGCRWIEGCPVWLGKVAVDKRVHIGYQWILYVPFLKIAMFFPKTPPKWFFNWHCPIWKIVMPFRMFFFNSWWFGVDQIWTTCALKIGPFEIISCFHVGHARTWLAFQDLAFEYLDPQVPFFSNDKNKTTDPPCC